MNHIKRQSRIVAGLLAVAFICSGLLTPLPARAGTTGNITGTITDASTGAPLANVKVMAVSLSQTATSTSDAKGFYSVLDLTPDTYTVTFTRTGYESATASGVTVVQDQTVTVNQQLHVALKTIASVHSSAQANLVKPNQGSDVYTVGGAQLQAATNPGDLHETLYQYMAVTPGVTGTGFPAQPRVRGGQVTDLGYEFEGIPIQDRIVGFFTSNLANIGISNIEVYTGGLPASGAANGTGYFNSVMKTGTYPAFSNLALQASSPEFNNYLTAERGAATIDHKFSYYIGFDGVNSQNQYSYGEHTYPNVVMWGFDGPGPVKTRDWVSNLVYRPGPADSIQAVVTNSNGDFDFNYLINKAAGEPPALAFDRCSGALVADPNSVTGFSGGAAPNGQSCPTGLYWGVLPNGGGNIWHHYGGLGKIQWNHNLNDHSFFSLRLAENFNQYIFDQPLADPNVPQWENPGGGWNWSSDVLGLPSSACPSYPYTAGTPVQMPVGDTGPFGDFCAFFDGIEVFWGDRRSNLYVGNLDYTNALNANTTIKAGISDEYDNNVFNYYLTNGLNADSSFPQVYEISTYPTTRQQGYGEVDFHAGKFLFEPGALWAQEHYGYPGGGHTVSILNPTFNGTYTFGLNDVLRFSYGNTASFIASAYVYTRPDSLILRNPNSAGVSFSPQINHSADLMWEHQFDANTSLRFGPYYNKTTNYYESYRPIIGYQSNGAPIFSRSTILSNANQHQTFGFELGLNHINNASKGMSYWISATYDNYWTSATALAGAFISTPLPLNITNAGTLVRAFANPLFSGTILTDFHNDRFHLDPLLYYQVDNFYNIGHLGCTTYPTSNIFTCSRHSGTLQINQPEQINGGWWRAKLTMYELLGPKRNVYLGLTADNLFNQVNDVTPCKSDGTGCFPFDGPMSGVVTAPGTYINQNYSQGARTFYFFGGIRM